MQNNFCLRLKKGGVKLLFLSFKVKKNTPYKLVSRSLTFIFRYLAKNITYLRNGGVLNDIGFITLRKQFLNVVVIDSI